ncbi:VOC family protein [Ramlibacter sp. AN1133]|uniref:VOC family protein n=1 Tax=Ramlibacter sp. AN1133 TaxID=3133429 RepID=UPI0030C46419
MPDVSESATMLRLARPSDDLDALLAFYREGLGLELLASFSGHQGFDGVILGGHGLPWQLEFTHQQGHPAGRAPSRDHLLVFYLPQREAWQAAVASMQRAGFAPVPAWNPYWDRQGLTYEDPDGYRVVLQNAVWNAA